jgi:PHS family inorganic phosphate transporter-like MFS transporter
MPAKQQRKRREQKILRILDGIGFNWRVYLVAMLGFLASSWCLISINIVSPALYFIYTPSGRFAADPSFLLDIVTLTATVVGMVLFGLLADRLGRSALYGFELLIVLSAVGGAAFSSEGYMVYGVDSKPYRSSMDIYKSLFWWRAMLGCGIGAEVGQFIVLPSVFLLD